MRWHIAGWALGMLAMLAGCATPEESAARLRPSGLTMPLPTADYAAYVETAARRIGLANQKIRRPLSPETIAERAPFELVPTTRRCRQHGTPRHDRGVLLIHGLGASPFQMRDLAARFAAACYHTRTILLPGHGSVPGDLETVDLEAWRAASHAGVASFKEQVEELVIAGFGLGASLALDYALRTPAAADPALAGLVLLAPDLPSHPGSFGIGGLGRLGTLVEQFKGWRTIHDDDDPAGYESMAENALVQRQRLLTDLAFAPPLDLPAFVAVSADDATIDPLAARAWFCTRLTGPRQLLWYSRVPDGVAECDAITARSSSLSPEILDLAHPALPIAPSNRHYGVHGDYLSCGHYDHEQATPAWFICADRSTIHRVAVRFGEISPANLRHHVIRRLTWNPDFAGMTKALLRFLREHG